MTRNIFDGNADALKKKNHAMLHCMKPFGENGTDEEYCCCTMWRVDVAKPSVFMRPEMFP